MNQNTVSNEIVSSGKQGDTHVLADSEESTQPWTIITNGKGSSLNKLSEAKNSKSNGYDKA